MASLAVSCKCAVYPEVKRVAHTVEYQYYALIRPVFGHGKLPFVTARGVLIGNLRRHYGKRNVHIKVVFNVVAKELPAPRHGYAVPVACVKSVFFKAFGCLCRSVGVFKVPRSAKQFKVIRKSSFALHSFFLAFKRDKRCVRRQSVPAENV